MRTGPSRRKCGVREEDGGEARAYDVKIAQLSKCLRDDSPPLCLSRLPLHLFKDVAVIGRSS